MVIEPQARPRYTIGSLACSEKDAINRGQKDVLENGLAVVMGVQKEVQCDVTVRERALPS